MSARQFVPPLFVLALLLLCVTAPISTLSKWSLIATLGAYGVLSLAATIAAAARAGWRFFPLFPIAFTIIHLAYGAGFLVGICGFWNRWGDHTTSVSPEGRQIVAGG
jgi:hypothetical protein